MLLLDVLFAVACVASGLVLVLVSTLVFLVSRRVEVSTRTLAAALVGVAGAFLLGAGLTGGTPGRWVLVLLATGVAMWLVHAMRRRQGQEMRRATDLMGLDEGALSDMWAGGRHVE